jgi:hypothetical protein
MDKRQSRRAALAVLGTLVAVLCFWLPGAFRIQAVASLGVLTANAIGVVALVVGSASVIVSIGAIGLSVRQFAIDKMTADQAALEAKQWDALPSREETNPDLLEPALRRVAKRYPKVEPLIEITFDQLASVRRSLDKIGDIFEANAGIITQEPGRYGNVERLIELLSQRICPGLVRIVYQAHEQDDSDAAIHDLTSVIKQVNHDNQIRVDQARDLTNRVVAASTEGDIDTVTSEVETAIAQLTSTTRKGDWL